MRICMRVSLLFHKGDEYGNKNLEETDVNEKQKARNGKSAMPMRTCLVMILAGVYVAYLGVSLCQNVINGAEGSSPGFMVAGVILLCLAWLS